MTNLLRQRHHAQAVEDLERFKVEKRMSEIGLQREDEAEYLKNKKAASCRRGET